MPVANTLAILILACLPGLYSADLTLAVYSNSALHGAPSETRQISDLKNLSFPIHSPFSAEVTGQVVLDSSDFFAFNCLFQNAEVAIVWVDDHLVCASNTAFSTNKGTMDGTPMNPLLGQSGKTLTVVIHVYQSRVHEDFRDMSLSVQWVHLKEPVPFEKVPDFDDIPASQFLADLPEAEITRRTLQQKVRQGWNLWSYNLLSVVRLPESCSITTVLCKISTNKCLLETRVEDTAAEVRVGLFATDFSYWHYYLGFEGLNLSMSFSGGANLSVLIEPLNCGHDAGQVDCSDFALALVPTFKWLRAGTILLDQDLISVTFAPYGQQDLTLSLSQKGSDLPLPIPGSDRYIALRLDSQAAIAVATSQSAKVVDVDDTRKLIAAARQREVSRLEAFTKDTEGGDRYSTKEALQCATMWNLIYVPTEYGAILPVSRAWNFVDGAISSDWHYVIFDWDNIFASYMSSLDPTSKDIAYSNLIQVIRSRTAKGFVPNFAAAARKSIDRTEPPIGAKVVLEIYQKYKDIWLVELLFNDLLEWNDWFLRERVLQPLGLISLGSECIIGSNDTSGACNMQAARYESGLDNSPMYDGEFFNQSSQLMELYDVGMSSMFVQEAEGLVALAKIIGRTAEQAKLSERAAHMRKLIALNLWDQQGGIFTNRFPNGSFYRRITPTSFYAMLANAASDEQAASMMKNWLMNPKHFCIAPNGDFQGNSDSCYWGLPSIEASDVAFPPLGYWRGYVWGPIAQLTYWSLKAYDHVPEVRQGRQALCKQMNQLMLWQWRKNRHICENFSPHRTADDSNGDCSGTKFYHWGALNGMIALLEDGFWKSEVELNVII